MSGWSQLAAASAKKRVVVVVPDLTRPWSPEVLVPQLTEVLRDAADLQFVVGLGLHRRLTASDRARFPLPPEQLFEAGGSQTDSIELISDVGGLERPLAAVFDRRVVQADLRVAVSVVEPHQYAGFSGGAKAMAVGCAAAETIDRLHGLELLRDPKTRVACFEDNPFASALRRLVAPLGPSWGVCFVPSVPKPFVGPLFEAHDRAIAAAQDKLLHWHKDKVNCAEVQVPASKAASFYQACRAATYLSEVDPSILSEGGTVVMHADCPEGLGLGAGELRFAQFLARGPDVLMAELEGRAPPPSTMGGGAQRAYVLARCLTRHRIVRVGTTPLPQLEAFGIEDRRSFSLPPDALSVDPFTRLPMLEADG